METAPGDDIGGETPKAAKDFKSNNLNEAEYIEKLSNLRKQTETYMDYKKDKINGNVASTRMALAAELKAFIDQSLPEDKKTVDIEKSPVNSTREKDDLLKEEVKRPERLTGIAKKDIQTPTLDYTKK